MDNFDFGICYADKKLSNNGYVIIDNNCWIGEHCSILPNVKIGRGSVVGANSVVTKDVPQFSIVAGVPAMIIKKYDHKRKKWVKI